MKNKRSVRGKVGVAKGFGPRHGENAAEGEPVDLTKVPSDTVAAMLTPREAVLNRNAAELAGRGNIEQLNAEGNVLAKKGVDLAAKGQARVPDVKLPVAKKVASGNVTKYLLPGTLRREVEADLPKLGKGTENMKQSKPKPSGYARGRAQIGGSGGGFNPAADVGGYYGNMAQQQAPPAWMDASGGPAGRPQPILMGSPTPAQRDIGPVAGAGIGVTPYSTSGGGGFYPPGQGFNKPYGMAEGSTEVPGGIGVPNPSKAYDPREVEFKAPDISGFLQAIHAEAKKQGISEGQMMQIAKQIGGGFGGGASSGGGLPYDQLGGQYANFDVTQNATPFSGYQGGISDIGYPPFIMPNAEYHADKGSTWEGAYDPAYLVQRYARGSGDVGRFNPDFQSPEPGYFGKLSSGAYPGPNFNNPNDPSNAPDLPPIGRSLTPRLDQFDTQQANYYRQLQGGFGGFGNTPPAGTPGFLQGSTLHNNVFDAQGYPYAQPVNSSDNPLPHPHWGTKQRS